MAQRICRFSGLTPSPPLNSKLRRNHYQCCLNSNSNAPNSRKSYASSNRKTETPQILKTAVSAVTELLRLFSPSNQTTALRGDAEKLRDEFPVSSVDDVLNIIKSDYDKAYFVTGRGSSQGTSLLQFMLKIVSSKIQLLNFVVGSYMPRNLKLLVPFFDCASIRLQKIEKDVDSEINFVLATWTLRTNLKLPWRPLISIDGSTYYELDKDFKIVRHVEGWNVSALEAILQIFTFKFENSGG